MPRSSPLRHAVCALALLASAALAQGARDTEPLPKDPDALVALMAGENLPAESRKRAIVNTRATRAAAVLVEMKDDAVPALAKALGSDDQSVRLNAVWVLARIGTPATLPPRIKASSDADSQVRAQAVAGLPAYEDDEARRALLQALKDPEAVVRNVAVRAFRPRDEKKLPDNSLRFATATALIPLLDDPAVRRAAADTLGHIGMNVAARPLLKLLDAEDTDVRSAAVEALGRLKDNQVAMELTAALRDRDAHVRTYAARSLGQIGDLRTTPSLVEAFTDKEPSVRRDAALALAEIRDLRAVSRLLPLLEDPHEQVRGAAAEALGRIGDPRAVEPLCAMLAREGGEGREGREGRENASVAVALGRLRDPRAVEPLTRYLLSHESRIYGFREAAHAIAQIRQPDSIAALVKVILDTRHGGANDAARDALRDLTGVSFIHQPNKAVADWWSRNREHYLRPLPAGK